MAKSRKEAADAGPARQDDGFAEGGFEEALERLEEIVERMEQGDLALEEAMSLFEEGVKLGQACQKRLDEAERKISILLERADGSVVVEDFDPAAAPRAEPAAPAPRAVAPRRSPAEPAAPATRPPARQPAFGDPTGPDDIPF